MSNISSGQRISVPDGWKWTDADSKHGDDYLSAPKQDGDAPLGILTYLEDKTFVGGGINMLFRPNNIQNSTKFPNPISPDPPTPPNNNVLEINLFEEKLTFSKAVAHSIPNRGFKCQGDICLNAIMYVQTVNDVTNCQTGLPDDLPGTPIHAENGFFVHVPASDKDPVVGATINRLGSIPHGVSINLQGVEPTAATLGPPPISPRPNVTTPTPFIQSSDPPEDFPALKVVNDHSARIPQVLEPFVKTGTITNDIMSDPTDVLRAVNQTRNILSTITLSMSSSNTTANVPSGGGVVGNAFLDGTGEAGKGNASPSEVDFTLWIETVEYQVPLPAGTTMTAGTAVTVTFEGITYTLTPPKDIMVPDAGQTIPVKVTELQYFQMVVLQFGVLSWPHPTVSTLKPVCWEVNEGDAAWSGL
ncbi:hypothetical protein V8F20_010930 [Naviculisporaceae sp. PSN 640]